MPKWEAPVRVAAQGCTYRHLRIFFTKPDMNPVSLNRDIGKRTVSHFRYKQTINIQMPLLFFAYGAWFGSSLFVRRRETAGDEKHDSVLLNGVG